MHIWVDADACPGEIKELLFRAAQRTKTKVTLVANQTMRTPRCEFVDSLLVPAGMNVADRRIVELAEPGDLVITADVPLAAQVVAKGGQALDPRGELYTEANVGERLAVVGYSRGFRIIPMPDEIPEEEAESLRLPRNWHTLVRSAVLQVIGIVRIAMITGREALIKNGDAPDARIHQLESEVAMPREVVAYH